MSFYSESELNELGFKSVGAKVKVSRKASIYNAGNIIIGDCSRIDDFCVLSAGEGGIVIGRHVHIAVFSSLIGKEMIELSDFSNISSRVSIYSSNDDYSGKFMSNPTVPDQFTNVTHAPVYIERHVIVGAGTVILPGVTIDEGAGVGALSLVTKNCEPFSMNAGIPARRIGDRSMDLLEIEKHFTKFESGVI